VKTLVDGLQDDLRRLGDHTAPYGGLDASPLLVQPSSALGLAFARVLVAHTATAHGHAPGGELAAALEPARASLRASGLPLARALLLLSAGASAPDEADRLLGAVRRETPTIDRALTLVWVQRAVGGTPAAGAPEPEVRGEWRREPGQWLGGARWHFTGAGRPATLQLASAPSRSLTALVRYESATPDVHRLPVTIERRLYRLAPGGTKLEFTRELVAPGTALSSKELYLEEVTLTPAEDARVRYALLEVPLPPGADVEATTWRMKIGGVALERARHEPGDLAYAIPIDALTRTVTVRHLVRFSQRGRFTLPPARLFRMYEPGDTALEDEGRGPRVVEVR
jgi:uncharacterized protein YfaS (alpha-2-macroglobulin family)